MSPLFDPALLGVLGRIVARTNRREDSMSASDNGGQDQRGPDVLGAHHSPSLSVPDCLDRPPLGPAETNGSAGPTYATQAGSPGSAVSPAADTLRTTSTTAPVPSPAADARSLARAPRSAVSVVGLRASDAEREQTAARLYEALGEGRLDLAETEERVAAAYAARYRAGLAPLLADLPDSPHGPAALSQSPAPGWAAIWTLLVWRARSLLWPATRAAGPPSRWECRVAAVLTMLAVIWTMVCAVLGAALVAL